MKSGMSFRWFFMAACCLAYQPAYAQAQDECNRTAVRFMVDDAQPQAKALGCGKAYLQACEKRYESKSNNWYKYCDLGRRIAAAGCYEGLHQLSAKTGWLVDAICHSISGYGLYDHYSRIIPIVVINGLESHDAEFHLVSTSGAYSTATDSLKPGDVLAKGLWDTKKVDERESINVKVKVQVKRKWEGDVTRHLDNVDPRNQFVTVKSKDGDYHLHRHFYADTE